jgi:tetratricopeptide (TPR) repeat protein
MEKAMKTSIREHVTQFIQKFRIALLAILSLIVIGIIVAVVYEEVHKSSVAAVTSMVEKVDAAHAALLAAKTDEEKAALLQDFEATVKQAGDSFKGSYAEQRALFLKGTYFYNEKKYDESETLFLNASQVLSNSYLAPIALINAAFAAEDKGENTKSVEYLNKLVKDYEKISAQVPRALFNIGRLHEASENWKDANAAYQKILDAFSGSNWTKFARDRIIYLKSQQKL